MKILSDEEKNAHWNHVLVEGFKGCGIGLVASYGLVTFMKRKHPQTYSHMSTSIRAAMWAMPTISFGALFADEGSIQFDDDTYRGEYKMKQKVEEDERWNKLSLADKCFTKVNDNKYKLIIGSWAASLYGSWTIVNKDKYMTTAQKAVQARVYAQAITVVLLLGTILLSLHEQELKKLQPPPVPEWKKYLDEQATLKEEHSHDKKQTSSQ